MIDGMATVRITEAELARDVRAGLEKVERGSEITEREDHRLLAVMKHPEPSGSADQRVHCPRLGLRKETRLFTVLDEDFAREDQDGIDAHREPIRNVWDE